MTKHKCGVVVEFLRYRDYRHAKHLIKSMKPSLRMEPDGVDSLFFILDDRNKLLALREDVSLVLSGMTYTMKNV